MCSPVQYIIRKVVEMGKLCTSRPTVRRQLAYARFCCTGVKSGLKKFSQDKMAMTFAFVALMSCLATFTYVVMTSGDGNEVLGSVQRTVLEYETTEISNKQPIKSTELLDEQPVKITELSEEQPVKTDQETDTSQAAKTRKRIFLQSPMGRKIQGIFVRLQHEKENMTSIVHEMGLDKSVLDRSIVNWGNVIRLKRAFREVIETGRVLKIGIMGGSVSAVNVYPRLLEKALKRILDSDVSIYNGAIGATDSQYYAYCMRNHLDTQNLDIIIWELAVNDFLKGVSPSGQEEITRQVIELPNKPQLLYVNFLFGKQIAKKSCNNSEDTGGRELSMYYAVPSISLSKAACRRIKAGKADDLLGGVNKNHLSSKAHLQMELFLRYFMVNVLSNVTWEILESKTSLSSEVMTEVEHVPGPLPPTYFMDTRVTKPKCWSALLPQLGIGEYLWPIRAADGWDKVPVHSDSGDRKQVWVGSKNGSVIRFPISIEPYENLTSKLAISTFTCENCGSVRAIVDNDFARAATISGRSQHRITWPTVIATNLEPGSHNITIKCLSDDPFHLAAIATAYDLTTPLSIFT